MGTCTEHEDWYNNICWCSGNSPRPAVLLGDTFAWLDLYLPIYKMKFLFADYLFASSFAGFCSDDKWSACW